MRRARVAIVSPYWSFWESTLSGDLRDEKLKLEDACAEALDEFDLVRVPLVDSVAAGGTAAELILKHDVDAVLVVQSMAVPPAFVTPVVVTQTPCVVWAVLSAVTPDADYDEAAITAGGATVGTPQLFNIFGRKGCHAQLELGRVNSATTQTAVTAALRAASTARRLSQMRVARVGEPIPGYECVDVDEDALEQAVGLRFVQVAAAQLVDAWGNVPTATVDAVAARVRREFVVADRAEEDERLARSVRFSEALRTLSDTLSLDGGVMNCHVDEIRFSATIGLTPCFALGEETSRGRPWTCSGDAVTLVAMLVAKLLGHAAVYHEIETLDLDSQTVILANTGEHDRSAAGAVKPELVPNQWFAGDPRCGVCACFSPDAGPGSLIAFTPHHAERSGFRFVVAEGEFARAQFPSTGTFNASFRFAGNDDVGVVWRRWCESGVNHHSAATLGLVATEVEAVAKHLGVGFVQVS